MINKKHTWKTWLLLVIAALWMCSVPVLASEDDNSLASLGILTEGAQVSPELTYGTIEYDVTVPAGTTEIQLDPVPTAEGAWIVDITGTELVDGKATVEIVVSAANGDRYSYFLYVTADESAGTVAPVETEPETQTEPETEAETEPETEDPRYVKVDRNLLEEAESTIDALKTETSSYRSRVGILTKILYGMIAFCVILLFIVINLVLKKKDLRAELQAYRGFGYPQETPDDYANGQDYNGQAYEARGYQGYEAQGYEAQGYDDQGYYDYSGQGGSEEYYEEPQQAKPQKPQKQKKAKKAKDDPATVPKPSGAKKQRKQMPEYQQPAQPYEYEQPVPKKKDNKVEVTMIDL